MNRLDTDDGQVPLACDYATIVAVASEENQSIPTCLRRFYGDRKSAFLKSRSLLSIFRRSIPMEMHCNAYRQKRNGCSCALDPLRKIIESLKRQNVKVAVLSRAHSQRMRDERSIQMTRSIIESSANPSFQEYREASFRQTKVGIGLGEIIYIRPRMWQDAGSVKVRNISETDH